MKKITLFLSAMLFCAMTFAAEILTHDLVPAKGSNNSYAGNCDVVINGITWNLTGNSQMIPWRIGGKNLTKQDRALYSKTAFPYDITKIEVTHGTAKDITVNSFKLVVSDEANGAGTEIPVTFKAGATTTIELPAGDYTNKYFKFLYNVSVTDKEKNKFIQFEGAKFYAEVNDNATKYTITATVNDSKMGTVTGTGEYIEGITAILNAVANPGYEFVQWEDGSNDNPRSIVVKADTKVTATFKAQTPITIAEAMELETGEAFVLNQFIAIQFQGGSTYIKDESGYGVIYSYDLGLKPGDVVASMPCTKGEYYGFGQFVPAVTKNDLTITTGELPEPELYTTAPTKDDMYKYVQLNNVTISGSAIKLADATTINYYNATTLVEGKKYNIVGSVGHYKGSLQIIVSESEEAPSTAVDNVLVEKNIRKFFENGQLVIVKDGVRYNAQGQQID